MIDMPGIISRGINVTNEDIVIRDNFADEKSCRARSDSYLIYMHTTWKDAEMILIGLILIRRDPVFRTYVIRTMIDTNYSQLQH